MTNTRSRLKLKHVSNDCYRTKRIIVHGNSNWICRRDRQQARMLDVRRTCGRDHHTFLSGFCTSTHSRRRFSTASWKHGNLLSYIYIPQSGDSVAGEKADLLSSGSDVLSPNDLVSIRRSSSRVGTQRRLVGASTPSSVCNNIRTFGSEKEDAMINRLASGSEQLIC